MDEFLNKTWNIGHYKIQEFCMESFPCQHCIEDTRTGKIFRLRGDEIFVMLRNDGFSHPHFEYCREIVRKKERPTAEEIAESIRNEIEHNEQTRRQYEESERKQKELDAIINSSKASSRLEKLKKQNNIWK